MCVIVVLGLEEEVYEDGSGRGEGFAQAGRGGGEGWVAGVVDHAAEDVGAF